MKIEKIKPIPKYILNLIKKADKQDRLNQNSQKRFYAYLTTNDKELVKVTVAVKNKGKNWYCKQVAIHGVNSKDCFIKDIEYTWIAGYSVGWYEQGLQKEPKYYEYGNWGCADDTYFDPFAPIVNREYALKFEKYKYSLANEYTYQDYIKYLRTYEQYPQAEYLMKLNLKYYATSKTILKLIEKDKQFRKWLIKNKLEMYLKSYYVSTIISAYKQNKDLDKTQQLETFIKSFSNNEHYREIKELFNGNIEQFFNYITSQQIDASLYIDYLNACKYLKLNMQENKNKIPHNFKRWHDIRIDEYTTAKQKADEEKRKAFNLKFLNIANKYLSLQHNLKDVYISIIPTSPDDLVYEGKKLHHCVGSMNYDQKFVREESLIFFIRNKNKPNKPFVTLEYSLKNHKILQCYADHNSKPDSKVMNFINKVWLPYANKQLRQLAI